MPPFLSCDQALDTFELMRSAYFTRSSNSLPDLSEPVPKIETNFYMWLSCRKQQWRKHRADKRISRKVTPEEDFPRSEFLKAVASFSGCTSSSN